ncbi:MAG TPA: hypothetical protein VFQ60_05155 [Patescibacteria group bacterium]|nr:hypothetical protein [Patescibacteria group bacterium]
MLPLSWFLIGWLILMAIFAIVVLLTITVYLRYGVAYPTTYIASIIFLSVIAIVFISACSYLAGVDWSGSINPFGIKPSLF